MNKRFLYLLFSFLPLGILQSCGDDDDEKPAPTTAQMQFEFRNQVDGQDLQLDVQSYTSPAGETYRVNDLRYYISNVKLRNTQAEGFYAEPKSYHLLSQRASKRSFSLQHLSPGTYNEIEFAIGVDNAINNSLDQFGDLDPNTDMYWGWKTGYKFMVMTGTYNRGSNPPGDLMYHIGENEAYRVLRFRLPQALVVEAGRNYSATFSFDVNEMFKTPTLVVFDQLNNTHGGPTAITLADNYADGGFKLVSAAQQ